MVTDYRIIGIHFPTTRTNKSSYEHKHVNATVLTQNELEFLRKFRAKGIRWLLVTGIPLLAVGLAIVAFINIHYCSRFAAAAGTNATEIIRSWIEGINTSSQYPGVYLKAMERWVTALTQLTGAGFLVVIYKPLRRLFHLCMKILDSFDVDSERHGRVTPP
jgi:hypothetical protein